MLVEEYRHGAGMAVLATKYGVHRHTVDQHLKQRSVAKRPVVKMTPARIARARKLYEGGWSVNRIGRELGVNGSTVRKAMKRVA